MAAEHCHVERAQRVEVIDVVAEANAKESIERLPRHALHQNRPSGGEVL